MPCEQGHFGHAGVHPPVPLPAVDPDLDWLLTVAPALLGLRSTHGSRKLQALRKAVRPLLAKLHPPKV